MAFCSNCGKKLNAGAKFCDECGAGVRAESKNQTVFEGNTHKCFHCGQPLGAFETRCRFCGTELRDVRSSNAVGELAEKLENASSEQQRINIIKNFPIPNTKEDIFEFMVLASSNFDSSYYAAHLYEEDISDAWLSKIEQCYEKAKLSFGAHSDFAIVESMYLKIKNECTEKENKIKYEEKEETKARLENAKQFQKSKLRIVLIVFSVISALFCAVAFSDGKILAGVIAIAMFALFILAFLMGSNVIKEKIANIKLIPIILAFSLLVPYFYAWDENLETPDNQNKLPNEKIYEILDWDELVLGNMLPRSNFVSGRIITNSDSELQIYLADATKTAFLDYIQKCKSRGFTFDSSQSTNDYDAYDDNGYRLYLHFNETDSELSIKLYDPVKRNNLNWKTVPLMENMPTPPSMVGEFLLNFDWTVSVYVLDVSYNDYELYVDKCIDAGFTIDFSRYETLFYGDNKGGDELKVSWEGNNTMHISITNYEKF